MTTVGGIGNFGFGVTDPGSVKQNGELDKDAFLKLLVEQMKNQDPMDPMDNQEFISQMAQFSSLEQEMGINQNLQTLQLAMLAQNNAQSAALVGRVVTAKGDTFQFGGSSTDLSYNLGASAQKVRITIKDDHGQVVRTVELGETGSGDNVFTWDGKNDEGMPLAPGNYSFTVEAWDQGGNAITTATYVKGTVTEVYFDKGYPELMVAGRRIKLGDVVGVAQPPQGTGTDVTI